MILKEKDGSYDDDHTDNEEPKPPEVKSNVDVKTEEEDTDDEAYPSSQIWYVCSSYPGYNYCLISFYLLLLTHTDGCHLFCRFQ